MSYLETLGHLELAQVSTRTDADRWHDVEAECNAVDYVELPADPVQEVYDLVERSRSDQRTELWLGSADSELVAIGSLTLPMLDNLDNASVDVRVLPSARRQGHGRAMLNHLLMAAQAHGRHRLIGEACEPLTGTTTSDDSRSPGQAFALAVGASAVTLEIRRMLRIAELDRELLARLEATALLASGNYSVVQFEGPAPDELVDDLALLQARMSTDAPLEDLHWAPEVWTRQRYRENEASIAAAGRERLVTAARDNATGRVVAFTDIALSTALPEIAHQWATIVLHEHRGHRLGMRIKAANLKYLTTTRPEVASIDTWNAAVNSHMVSINEAIGYRPIECWREWELEVRP